MAKRILTEEQKAKNRERAKAWYEAHKNDEDFKKRAKEYHAEHYQNNKDRISKQVKEYDEAHKEERQTRMKMTRKQTRLLVFEHYGGKCECCGEDRYEFLAIDHIEGNGKEDRKKGLSGYAMAKYLVENNFPEGYRILCHNCNQSLGLYGYCPHHPEIKISYGINGIKEEVCEEDLEFCDADLTTDSSGSVDSVCDT